MRPLIVAIAAFSFFVALSNSTLSEPQTELDVKDLTPKFLTFYAAASQPGVDEPKRWELWHSMYGFAAVPPTPEGETMARNMLDQAWPKYQEALPTIKRGIYAIHPAPRETLRNVASLLKAGVPVKARLIVAVGDFEGNAFTAPGSDGVPTVSVEVEDPNAGFTLMHEFTHVVEAEQAGLSLDWKRSLTHTIFVEGLAMRTVQALNPGRPDAEYVGEFSPDWLARCSAQRNPILRDLKPHLESSDSGTVMRYTMGKGGLGIEREAYFAGWLVVGDMLRHGWGFPGLARVNDQQMVELVSKSISRIEIQ